MFTTVSQVHPRMSWKGKRRSIQFYTQKIHGCPHQDPTFKLFGNRRGRLFFDGNPKSLNFYVLVIWRGKMVYLATFTMKKYQTVGTYTICAMVKVVAILGMGDRAPPLMTESLFHGALFSPLRNWVDEWPSPIIWKIHGSGSTRSHIYRSAGLLRGSGYLVSG